MFCIRKIQKVDHHAKEARDDRPRPKRQAIFLIYGWRHKIPTCCPAHQPGGYFPAGQSGRFKVMKFGLSYLKLINSFEDFFLKQTSYKKVVLELLRNRPLSFISTFSKTLKMV